MGRRTHKKEIPEDAIYFKGRPWTPLMIMAYCGITRYKYNQTVAVKSPETLLEWGSVAVPVTVRRVGRDTTMVVKLSTTLTLLQWYYLAVKDGLETPVTYTEFTRRFYHYLNRHGFNKNDQGYSEALFATLRSMGREHISTWTRAKLETMPATLGRLESGEYRDVIHKYHLAVKQGRKPDIVKEPPNANASWFKCLLADTRLHWLFVEEFETQMCEKNKHIERVEQQNKELLQKFEVMAIKCKTMEKQLADFGRSKASQKR